MWGFDRMAQSLERRKGEQSLSRPDWFRRCGWSYAERVPTMRISEVAELLAVSDDTVRRWVDSGRLAATPDASGRLVIDGADLAAHLAAAQTDDDARSRSSARNRFRGLVTRVVRDTVMAQVEIAAGPSRIVSLISRESADELGLEPGVVVTASIKSTNVVVELP
ncbi:MAG: hypothetical protein QOF57_1943 [Frankiaceae bacterium]|nr:hypothetical protein [Frankiaceae bacterium]